MERRNDDSMLLHASTWLRDARDPSLFTTTIDGRWAQGKGAFGGLLSAGLLRSMTPLVAPTQVVRTLHVSYCAPAKEGALSARVVIERAGAMVTTMSARATQDDTTVTLATATFVAPSSRPSPRAHWNDARMPEVADIADLEPLRLEDAAFLPAFTQFFEYRLCIGAMAFSGADAARMGGWVRVRAPYPAGVPCDAPMVAALIDAFPPAVLPRLDEPRPTASVNLTVDFLADPARARADGHFLLTSSARVGNGGTTDEWQELWSEDGVLLASCRQLVAIL